jgi:hypothetical protein
MAKHQLAGCVRAIYQHLQAVSINDRISRPIRGLAEDHAALEPDVVAPAQVITVDELSPDHHACTTSTGTLRGRPPFLPFARAAAAFVGERVEPATRAACFIHALEP